MADEDVREILSKSGYGFKRFISRGGQGKVYEVYDFRGNVDVALKMVSGNNSDARGRLKQEFNFLKTNAHTNLLTVYDPGEYVLKGHSYCWFTMELCVGSMMTHLTDSEVRKALARCTPATQQLVSSLRARGQPVRRLHVMEINDRIDRILESLHGLAYIHQQNISHRDIKPGNLLVHRSGRLKLGDFGTAKIAWAYARDDDRTANYLAGTPPYIGPEIWRCKDDSGLTEPDLIKADQYAAGVAACEILQRGRLPPKLELLPPQLKTAADWLEHRRIHQAGIFDALRIPDHSGTPDSVNSVLRKMLAPDPSHRYPDVARCVVELVAALLKDGLLRA